MRRGSPHPYQRLQGQLANLIASTPPGERLPAEPDLAKQLGRVTGNACARRCALLKGRALFAAGRVWAPLLCQPPVFESGLEVLESIESLAHRIGLDVSMGDLHIETICANAEQAEALGGTRKTPNWSRSAG